MPRSRANSSGFCALFIQPRLISSELSALHVHFAIGLSYLRDGPGKTSLIIKDHIRRNPGKSKSFLVEARHFHPHTVMLETRFVAEPSSVLVHDNIAKSRHLHRKRRHIFRELLPHGRCDRFHMPKIRAQILSELDPVSAISRVAIGVRGITLQIFLLHLFVNSNPPVAKITAFWARTRKEFPSLFAPSTAATPSFARSSILTGVLR